MEAPALAGAAGPSRGLPHRWLRRPACRSQPSPMDRPLRAAPYATPEKAPKL